MKNRTITISFSIFAACLTSYLMGISVSMITKAADPALPALQTSVSNAFVFTRNLQLGDVGEDVRQLQIILNQDADTQVSYTGSGSPGQESSYFGQFTKAAVMRFQEKYRSEILTPNNISSPTGYVGASTRQKLNSFAQNSTETASIGSTAGSSVVPQQNNQVNQTTQPRKAGQLLNLEEKLPRLYMVDPLQAKKGSQVKLVGEGFTLDNTVYIGSTKFEHVMPYDGNTLYLTLSSTSTLTNGTVDVWVENSYGSSKNNGPVIRLTITDSPQPRPTITGVLPLSTGLSGTITVSGTGFSGSGNTIISTLGTLENVSATGGSISFSPSQLVSEEAKKMLSKLPAGTLLKIDFYIVNSQGPTTEHGGFGLRL